MYTYIHVYMYICIYGYIYIYRVRQAVQEVQQDGVLGVQADPPCLKSPRHSFESSDLAFCTPIKTTAYLLSKSTCHAWSCQDTFLRQQTGPFAPPKWVWEGLGQGRDHHKCANFFVFGVNFTKQQWRKSPVSLQYWSICEKFRKYDDTNYEFIMILPETHIQNNKLMTNQPMTRVTKWQHENFMTMTKRFHDHDQMSFHDNKKKVKKSAVGGLLKVSFHDQNNELVT